MSEPIIKFTDGFGFEFGEGPTQALDFGTVQAQSLSSPERVDVENIGSAPLQDAIVDCVAFSTANGFGDDLQEGTPEETYDAVTFSTVEDPWDNSGNGYEAIAVGTGKVQNPPGPLTGGTLGISATETIWARWEPPAGASVGSKIWGMQITGNYT